MDTIELTNDFHRTTARVRPSKGGRLSHRQVKRAWRKLCGIDDCRCGGIAGERHGRYYVELVYKSDTVEGDVYRVVDGDAEMAAFERDALTTS